MANIDTLHWPALISRKIRVTEHFLSRNRNNFLKIILFYFFFYFSSEKPNNNHYLPTGQSRRGNKLKRRKAYYNRQRKDIAVSFCPF